MPFDLLKGIGADYAYNPMCHGISKREIQDTVRRMEVLMKDLDALQKRKEREKKTYEDRLVPDMNEGLWFGPNLDKIREQQAHERAQWIAMDRAGIEMELPYIEQALEQAPDETPPLRHEDYHQRCQNLQERRGEYWRINPEFRNQDDIAAGIGRPTPEGQQYWPTHQVPWQQGAPSPPPRTKTPPPRPPKQPWPFPPSRRVPLTSPSAPALTQAGSSTCPQTAPPATRAAPSRTTPSWWPGDDSFSSSSSRSPPSPPPYTPAPRRWQSDERFSSSPSISPCSITPPEITDYVSPSPPMRRDQRPLSSPPPSTPHRTRAAPPTTRQAALPPRQLAYPDATPSSACGTPQATPDISFLESGPLFTPPASGAAASDKDLQDLSAVVDEVEALAVQFMRLQSMAHEAVGTPTRSPSATRGQPKDDENAEQVFQEMQDKLDEMDEDEEGISDQVVKYDATDRDLQELSNAVDEMEQITDELAGASPGSPLGLITQQEFDTVGSDNFLTTQGYQTDAQQQTSPGRYDDWSPGIMDEETMHSEAFSPEQLSVDEMEVMMHDAAQRQAASELIDPSQLYSEAFSPEPLDDATLERMLQPAPGPTALLSPNAQQGLQVLASEPRCMDTAAKYGFNREAQWDERMDRWRKEEEKQREEWRRRAKSAHERQKQAASLFGVRTRGTSAPPTPSPTRAQCQPETLPWGESPVDHITPPGHTQEAAIAQRGFGKRLVRPKPTMGLRPDPRDTPPSRVLFPKTKGGPTVYQPDRPSTSNTIYNTRKGEYEHLDPWARSPLNLTEAEKNKLLEKHRMRYKRRLVPGPGVVAPKPAPPPPPPPPEYGPEPEHMSVYVPEAVAESQETFKQRVNEAIDRFERKLELVRQRLETKTKYRQQSPWVRDEYTGDERRARAKQKDREKEIKADYKTRQKWDTYMLCKYGTVPSPDKFGIMRGMPRTASTYRPKVYVPPPKKNAPVMKPYDAPLQGPSLPWVYGSNRPPPKTAAGRISSPCVPAPKPVVRRPVETPPSAPCPSRTTPRAQPSQVLYGSARAPPKTAASYKYQATPPGRPTSCEGAPPRRRRILPSTPEMLYGSTRPPPRTASSLRTLDFPLACPRPQTPPTSPQPPR